MKKIRTGKNLSPFEQELSYRLKDAPVPPVPLEEIDAAARAVSLWCAPAGNLWSRELWRAALASLTASAAPFWLLCAFLLGSGVAIGLLWSDLGAEPLAVLIPLAPVPLLCFLIRELQIRDPALIQLERSCLLDPALVCFLRMWAGMLVNGGMVALLGLLLGGDALRFCFCAFAALFFLGAVALLFLPLGGSAMPLSLLLAVWVLGAFWSLRQPGTVETIRGVDLSFWAGTAGAGLGLFALVSLGVTRKLYTGKELLQ